MRTISIINQSTVVSDADFKAAVAACQKQIDEHFGPAWGGVSCALVLVSAAPGVPQPATGEAIYILDDSDQQGALGYHEVGPADTPVGYVFAKTSADAGDPWQTTLSHELLEQLIDPYADTCAVVTLPAGRLFKRPVPAVVSYEVADPVENDTYLIDGVPVSNFVLPAWFQSADAPGIKAPFDYLGKLTAPLEMTPGGYFAFSRNLRTWQQASARQQVKPEKYHRHGKRRAA